MSSRDCGINHSQRVHTPVANSYANVKGLAEDSYPGMPLVEDAIVSYLVPDDI